MRAEEGAKTGEGREDTAPTRDDSTQGMGRMDSKAREGSKERKKNAKKTVVLLCSAGFPSFASVSASAPIPQAQPSLAKQSTRSRVLVSEQNPSSEHIMFHTVVLFSSHSLLFPFLPFLRHVPKYTSYALPPSLTSLIPDCIEYTLEAKPIPPAVDGTLGRRSLKCTQNRR
ncbi:hypothetical protein K435DRAFT_272341 [Dendrothele bispora CBS 962.96]|uniref:Uncharacterized protein n=1 Tax=Dendrothele bispora (strain CBS 962.96) TaxID=1314807 RepID=A0A4S8LM87_DENBC|nr:hypothetical protein K435DRAFT_272341 [Dendrothele bispora CBS 962.96]